MKTYLKLLETIINDGTVKESGRAGMPNTKGVFGYQMRFNLSDGFPLLTTKKMPFKIIAHELIWFLKGMTNIKYLVDNKVNIWNQDAYRHFKNKFPDVAPHKTIEQFIGDVELGVKFGGGYTCGDLGEVYGAQWRNWNDEYIDQIKNVIESIKKNPFGRRHIVTAWNPSEVDNMALPPCHLLFQFNCRPLTNDQRIAYAIRNDMYDGVGGVAEGTPKFYLDCALTQRSCDSFLGVPFNIASYALLTESVAKMCNMVAGEFIWNGNDVHIYDNHFTAVKEQLSREPMELCKLKISDRVKDFADISQLEITDLTIENYSSHPPIKGELSVGT